MDTLKNDESLDVYDEPKDSPFYNEEHPRIFIKMKGIEAGGWTYRRSGWLSHMEGHDAAIPVAMHLYDKYGVAFGDGAPMEVSYYRRIAGVEELIDENIIERYLYLDEMYHYFDYLEKEDEYYGGIKKKMANEILLLAPEYRKAREANDLDRKEEEDEKRWREKMKEKKEEIPSTFEGGLPF